MSAEAGLSAEQIEGFRRQLEDERRRLSGAVSYLEREDAGSLLDSSGELVSGSADNHPADTATETYERELDEGLEEGARRTLEQIDAALQRIADGGYGLCQSCGRPIGAERLAAQPWTPYCIDDAVRAE